MAREPEAAGVPSEPESELFPELNAAQHGNRSPLCAGTSPRSGGTRREFGREFGRHEEWSGPGGSGRSASGVGGGWHEAAARASWRVGDSDGLRDGGGCDRRTLMARHEAARSQLVEICISLKEINMLQVVFGRWAALRLRSAAMHSQLSVFASLEVRAPRQVVGRQVGRQVVSV